jgi:hypothetical protein
VPNHHDVPGDDPDRRLERLHGDSIIVGTATMIGMERFSVHGRHR